MRAAVVLAGMGMIGCDIVIGLDERPSPTLGVSLSLSTREVRNGADGVPVTSIIERDRVTPAVILEDGSRPEVTAHPDGHYTFQRLAEGQPYRVTVLPTVEYQIAAGELTAHELVIGRADRPAANGDVVRQVISNTVATGATSYLVTTGNWTETPHTVDSTGDRQQFEFPWTKAVLPGRFYDHVGAAASANHDRAFAVVRTPVMGGAYLRLTAACEDPAPFTLGQLLPAQLTCAVQPLTQVTCEHVRTASEQQLAQLATLVDPTAYTQQLHEWAITAVPAPGFYPQFGLMLAEKLVLQPAGTAVGDWNAPVDHANPYPGHAVSVRTRVARLRTVIAPGVANGAGLAAQIVSWRAAGAACGSSLAPLPPVAIAATPTLAGIALDQDGQHIALDRSQDVVLAWTTVGDGAADYYQVVLTAMTPVFNGTFLTQVRTYVTTTPSIVVAQGVLEAGKTYAFSIASHVGYPGAATGDFVTLAYPAAPLVISMNWSPTFVIDER